jgi:hypothetical protein
LAVTGVVLKIVVREGCCLPEVSVDQALGAELNRIVVAPTILKKLFLVATTVCCLSRMC